MIAVAVAIAIVLCEDQIEVIGNVKNRITTTRRTKNGRCITSSYGSSSSNFP